MAISITFNFDTPWATRIAAMVNAYDEWHHDELVTTLLEALDVTIDDLTAKQKWKLMTLVDTLNRLQNYEGSEAAEAARQVILDDINNNFPLEVGDA